MQRGKVGAGDVTDVDEVASLPAVLEDSRGGAAFQRRAEDRRHPGIRRVARHPGPVDVVVAQRDHATAAGVGPGGGEVFLGDLGRGVHAARVQPRVLVDEVRRQRGGAGGAARFEPAGGEVGDRAGGGSGRAVAGAGVGALAVDDHGAGQDEPADADPGHRGEQDGRAEVVAADVLGQVGEVHAHAHHGRVVHDRVDPGDGPADRVGVAQVADGDRYTEVHGGRCIAMCGGVQAVQHAYVVAGRGERRGHV